MRGVGADGLDVHAAEPAGRRDDDLDRRVAGQPSPCRPGRCRSSGCVIGVSPEATVAVLAMTGTKLPASLSFLKKCEALAARCRASRRWRAPEPRPPRWPGWMHGRVTGEGDLALVLGLEQVRPVLRDVLDRRGVDLEGQDAVVVAVPVAVRRPWPRPGCVSQVETLYGWMRPVGLGLSGRSVRPTSMTSGACGSGVVLVGLDGLDLVAGAGVRVQLVDRDAVLGVKPVDDLAVVAPVWGRAMVVGRPRPWRRR